MSDIHVQNLDSSVLVDIFLDGFCTGVATAHLGVGGGTYADRMADAYVSTLKGDPIAMEAVRNEIRERIKGIDSGPFTMTVFGKADPA